MVVYLYFRNMASVMQQKQRQIRYCYSLAKSEGGNWGGQGSTQF